jgi:hypothetical protein
MGKFRVEVTEIAKKHIAQHLKSGISLASNGLKRF